jgi:antitoxin (DNA-binding transcriptional repressor) of toxin-antitoxin stability system
MITVSLASATRQFTRLIKRVEENGETIVICRSGRPVAGLIPHRQEQQEPDSTPQSMGQLRETQHCSADFQSAVSPNCIRPPARQSMRFGKLPREADFKSAIQQNAILRYETAAAASAKRNVHPHPRLSKIQINYDPTDPMTADEWGSSTD